MPTNKVRMSKFVLLFLLVTFFTLYSSIAQDTLPDLKYRLGTFRSGEHSYYNPGTMLVVKYKSSGALKRVRGAFAGGFNGNIAISKTGRTHDLVYIPVQDLSMVRKVAPKKRLAYALIGTVAVGGGTAILESAGNTPGKAMKEALVIPVIGVGSYLLLAVPVTLLFEKLNERKRESGWKFELAR